ncbi:hypothetical protein CPB83DRAFT_854657 [Crepidotus variabilis]|uniref:DUF6534 domain-containing protein n=1 Tax=Crepidotus variabilis TaxID=179855 RepID=A0A9P6EEU2_9AGAR|nr:hypothetical protein CPB83DRAFT_854657 [Crepidotus variabilis]
MSTTLPTGGTVNIAAIAGPPLLACTLNAGLMGVLSVQTFIYYLAFPEDPWYTKTVAYTVYFIELAQMILVIISAFTMFADNFHNDSIFDEIGILWLVPPLTAIVTFIVQCYYGFRIRVVSRSFKVAGVIFVLSIIQLAGGLVVGHYAKREGKYSLLNTPRMLVVQGVSTGIWNLGSTVCDLIIAVYMIYYLSRIDTRMRQTKAVLRKIIRLTIETGALTTVIALVTFGLAMIPGNPMYYLVPMGIIGKVYANSLMVLINSRGDFHGFDTDTDDVGSCITPIDFVQEHTTMSQNFNTATILALQTTMGPRSISECSETGNSSPITEEDKEKTAAHFRGIKNNLQPSINT